MERGSSGRVVRQGSRRRRPLERGRAGEGRHDAAGTTVAPALADAPASHLPVTVTDHRRSDRLVGIGKGTYQSVARYSGGAGHRPSTVVKTFTVTR